MDNKQRVWVPLTAFLLLFVGSVNGLLARTNTVTVRLGKAECGDTCAVNIPNHKGPDATFLCRSEHMRPGSKVPVCVEIFGTGSTPLNREGRYATLNIKLESQQGARQTSWITGGRLLPVGEEVAVLSGKPPQQPQRPVPKKGDGGWDAWLEATGNKDKVAAPIAPAAVLTVGSAPASIEQVLKVCQHTVNVTGPGQPGVGSVYKIEYLAPVDADTVYGEMGPQGKLTPLRLHARYRDSEPMYTNAYLHKNAFGEFKCTRAS